MKFLKYKTSKWRIRSHFAFAILIGMIKGCFSWNILRECGREQQKVLSVRRLKFHFEMEQIGTFYRPRLRCHLAGDTNMADET